VRGKAAASSTLYASFKAWAELEGEYVISHRRLAEALKDHGFRPDRASVNGADQRVVRGLVLKSGAGTVP
jgi:hypothetical protein